MTALTREPLYRGSLLLMINTGVLGALGFGFWAVAARTFPAADIGVLAVVTSAVNLLCVVSAVGMPNLMTRDLSSSTAQRALIARGTAVVSTVGTAATAAAVLALQNTAVGRELFTLEHGPVLAIVLVLVTSLSSVLDASLIALRAQGILLVKSVTTGTIKIIALPGLATFGVRGLIGAYFAGALLSTIVAAIGIHRSTTASRRRRARESGASAGRAHFSAVNYIGTVLGILPATLVPMFAAHILGPEDAAWLSVSLMVAALLNVIPAASGQVLFAEVSRNRPLPTCLAKSARLAFGLLGPAVLLIVPLAPFVLTMFGPDYRAHATAPLQLLTLAALPGAINYLCDSAVIAARRPWLYVALNGTNSVLVLALTAALAGQGTTALAIGWLVAQALSAVIGSIALARIIPTPIKLRRPVPPATGPGPDIAPAAEERREILTTP